MPADQPHVGIIGLGLIGGSLGLALRQAGSYVTGFARRATVRLRARDIGAVDESVADLAALGAVEIVVLAVPVLATKQVLCDLAPHLRAHAIVTDVASTKAQVLTWAASCLPPAVSFVGGHPMAGKETAGIDYADGTLFQGRTWCIVPPRRADREAIAAVTKMAEATGAVPYEIEAVAHDQAVAATSHVPFLVATALAHAALGRANWSALCPLAGTGLRDTTRLGSGDPIMHRDICATNRQAILQELAVFSERIAAVAQLLEQEDDGRLLAYFQRIKAWRDTWLAKGSPTG